MFTDRCDALGDMMPVSVLRTDKRVVMKIGGSKRAVLESWAAESLTARTGQWVSGETP